MSSHTCHLCPRSIHLRRRTFVRRAPSLTYVIRPPGIRGPGHSPCASLVDQRGRVLAQDGGMPSTRNSRRNSPDEGPAVGEMEGGGHPAGLSPPTALKPLDPGSKPG